jgi:hypothetical protein
MSGELMITYKRRKFFTIILLASISFITGIQKSYSQGQYQIYLPIVYKGRTHFYAQAVNSGLFYGVWAIIETANPAIREPLFSYSSINISDNNGRWIETGWYKSPTDSCIPKFTWAIQPGNANVISSPTPTVGFSYQYMIDKVTDGNWRLQILKTDGTVIYSQNISNPGMNSGTLLQAVGEVDSPTEINDMGVSGILSLKWRESTPGIWHMWNGWVPGVIDYPPYQIVGLPSDPGNNVQVYGNNGNPIPPNAPCP